MLRTSLNVLKDEFFLVCNMLPESMFLCELQFYFAFMPWVVVTVCCMFIGV